MTLRQSILRAFIGIVAATAFATQAHAALVNVAYDGSYNENPEAPSNDYDAIGAA